MDFLADPVILARIQFAFTAMYHFLLVPVSIGLGLIMAIYETRAYRSGKEEDAAAARFWLKIFLTDPERKRMLRRLDFGSRSSLPIRKGRGCCGG